MPTDLTGTPTTLGIGTFNVDADAPSGLGFNEAMAQIDALIAGRVGVPAGIASGEAVVWDGSTFVRSSVLPITANGIGTGIVKSPYRKSSSKQVVNTTSLTDLLNGEVTIAAGAMGANGVLRLTAWGDMKNNSGGSVSTPQFLFQLGTTNLVESGVIVGAWSNAITRYPWRVQATIANLTASTQWVDFRAEALIGVAVSGAIGAAIGEGYTITSLVSGGVGLWKHSLSASAAVDTSVARALSLFVGLPTASTLEDVTLTGAVVEIL